MYSLREIDKESSSYVGTKAANLGAAIKCGLLVPEGFVLSFQYFEEFLKEHEIQYIPQQYMAKGRELQQLVMESSLSQAKKKELQVHLAQLQQINGCKSFAVRSSSNIEDSHSSSMAGMFESYLHLVTLEEVEEAVKKCYASLYSDRVLNYLYENNISFEQLKMGVILQEYMEGEAYGVLFTSDPVTMQENLLQVTMNNGCTAKQFDTAETASVYSIDKSSKEIKSINQYKNSSKMEEVLKNKLVALTIEVEKYFGCHQDVEWAYDKGRVSLLQVRPITTFYNIGFQPEWEYPEQEEFQWYRLYQAPCKPVMQDITKLEVEQQSKGAYETLFRTDTYGECIIQKGYAYVRSIPIEEEKEKREAYLTTLWELAEQGKCIYNDIFLPKLLALTEELKTYTGRNLSKQEIINYILIAKEYLAYCARQHWSMVQANEYLYKFNEEFLRTNKDMEFQDLFDLVSDFTILSRDRELLFHMSQTVKEDPKLVELFSTCPYDTVLYARLKECKTAEILLMQMNEYCKEFGNCDSCEGESLLPVIAERPDIIIGYIRRVLDLDEKEFYHNIDSAKEKKEKVKNTILQRLSAEEQKIFLKKLSLAEKAFLSNDNHNYYVERQYKGYLRQAMMEAGRYFCKENILEEKEDIAYLHLEEILQLLNGTDISSEIIRNRKASYEEQKRMIAPEILTKTLDIGEQEDVVDSHTKIMKDKDGQEQKLQENIRPTVLKGLSGLRKSVRGKVFVGIPQIPMEAILVMPHCHYGDIMPVIGKVKGLIFQWGSPFDHPGIIARELGIPAIYYIPGAMELLKTGDEVEINGQKGEVTIVSKAE